jgi:uncharacterized protein (TIGR02271 family)
MITTEQIPQVLGHTVYDGQHRKVGTAEHVYVDQASGQPEWLTVRTGMFGRRETFVPLAPAEVRGEEIIVPFDKEQIKNAPNVDIEIGEDLPAGEEARVYDYYGMPYGGVGHQTVTGTDMPTAGTAGTATGAPATGPRATGVPAETAGTDEAMTRSEEEMRVGTERVETGRARLRKYVTVEEEQRTVPVRREHVRVEREPITEENIDQAMAGPEISEAEHEVVLHEERPVVGTETVPKERVRLAKEETVREETVSGQVRKEHNAEEDILDEEQ